MNSSSPADSRKLFEYVIKECRLDPNHPIVRRALEAISAGRSSGGPSLFTMEDDGERVHFKVTEYGR